MPMNLNQFLEQYRNVGTDIRGLSGLENATLPYHPDFDLGNQLINKQLVNAQGMAAPESQGNTLNSYGMGNTTTPTTTDMSMWDQAMAKQQMSKYFDPNMGMRVNDSNMYLGPMFLGTGPEAGGTSMYKDVEDMMRRSYDSAMQNWIQEPFEKMHETLGNISRLQKQINEFDTIQQHGDVLGREYMGGGAEHTHDASDIWNHLLQLIKGGGTPATAP